MLGGFLDVAALVAAATDGDDTTSGPPDPLFWILLIGGGIWLWAKKTAKTEAEEKAAQEKALRDVNDQMWKWQAATQAARRAGRPKPRQPDPVRPPTTGSADLFPAGAQEARQVVCDVLSGLVFCVAEEARAHADTVHPPAERLCRPGRYRKEAGPKDTQEGKWKAERTGTRPTNKVVGLVEEIFAWARARQALLSGVRPDAARLLDDAVTPLAERFWRSLSTEYGIADDGAGIAVLAPGTWESLLGDLHTALIAIGTTLPALPSPGLLPPVHRPNEARFKDDMSGEAVELALDRFITDTMNLRQHALAGNWPAEFNDTWTPDGGTLRGFKTREVRDRLNEATAGFEHIAKWSVKDIAPESRAPIYLAYVTIALNYLTEVHHNMPTYRRDAENRPGNHVTIGENFHGVFVNDSQVDKIINVLQPVTARGDEDLTTAITALANAVRADPDVADDERSELILDVQDIAEAAAEPDNNRKRARATEALEAVTKAAKTAAQLGQTVTTWHEVLSKMF